MALLASPAEVKVKFTARGHEEGTVRKLLDAAEREARRRLRGVVVGTEEETIAGDVARHLVARGWTVAIAESCTGGLISHWLTEVPGSSAFFDRAAVTYSNRAKREMLGVPSHLLERHGAVSGPVAIAMARGLRRVARTDVGLAVTGIAGPGGGTPHKPVGLVYVALATPRGIQCRRFRFLGHRTAVQTHAALAALSLLRRAAQ